MNRQSLFECIPRFASNFFSWAVSENTRQKLWFSAVDFFCQRLYQTYITKIVIYFIYRILIKILKIHKKIDKYFLLEVIPHDLMNQCFILNLNQYLFEKNNYMDFSSHKAGCTRELFWVHMNLTIRSVSIPKFWDIGRVPILGLYQTKSIENTSPWSHYTQRLKLSVFIGA